MTRSAGSAGGRGEGAPVAAEDLGVVVLPGRAAGGARLRVEVALAMQAAVLAAGAGDAADLTVLVGGVADPVRTGVLHATRTSGADSRAACLRRCLEYQLAHVAGAGLLATAQALTCDCVGQDARQV